MTVTRIEPVTKTRFRIHIDGQQAFMLYKGELSRYGLAEGADIPEEVYDEIRSGVLLKRARQRVLHLLNDMDRTRSQLKTKLTAGGYPDDIAEEAIAYAASYGYVNDAAYARRFIDSRKNKKSRKEIYAALCRKGLAREEIDAAMEEAYNSGDSRAAIEKILKKKNYDPETAQDTEKRKIMGYLTRKGFCYEDIRQVIHVSEWNA